MLHATFIALHAVSGVVAFIAGWVAFRSGALYQLYLWSLVGMLLFVVLAIGINWSTLDIGTQVLFAALAALGVVMVWRGVLAGRIKPPGTGGYRDHIGFTLISLADAFVVVAVLDLGGPVWLVLAAAVIVGVAGHFALQYAKRRLASVT